MFFADDSQLYLLFEHNYYEHLNLLNIKCKFIVLQVNGTSGVVRNFKRYNNNNNIWGSYNYMVVIIGI